LMYYWGQFGECKAGCWEWPTTREM